MKFVIAPNSPYQRIVDGEDRADWGVGSCAYSNLSPDVCQQWAVFRLYESDTPIYDMATQVIEEGPVVLIDGDWHKSWNIVDKTAESLAAEAASRETIRIASLWQAAHDKEYEAISGSAIGLIAMGVLQGKPKCAAVQNWIKALWSEYYARKASGSDNLDFSIAGECPHTVPELMSELNI
jgi:hypothetical protein